MTETAVQLYEGRDLTLSRPPKVVLEEAKQAARALADVIANKKRPVIMNGEQYLEAEDWMTVGRFYGITARISETRLIEIDGIKGYEAVAEAVRNGEVISRAEMMCMKDESNWKSRPMFMLRSMAQTRALSKVHRQVLSWVVVLAGYKATPAEEMEGVYEPSKPAAEPAGPAAAAPGAIPSPPASPPPDAGPVISQGKGKLLYALAMSKGMSKEALAANFRAWYGCDLFKLPQSKFEEARKRLETLPSVPSPPKDGDDENQDITW